MLIFILINRMDVPAQVDESKSAMFVILDGRAQLLKDLPVAILQTVICQDELLENKVKLESVEYLSS